MLAVCHGGRGRGAVGRGGAHEKDKRHAERGSQETFEPGETRVPPEIEQEAADPGEHAQQHEDRGNTRADQTRLPVAPVNERMADRVDPAAKARHGRETRGELVDGHGGAPHDVRDHQEHVGQDDVERAAHIAAQVLDVAPQVACRFGALVDLADAVRPAADGKPFEGTVERERVDGRAGRMSDIRHEDDEAQQDRSDPGEHLVDQYAARPAGREKRTRHPYSPILSLKPVNVFAADGQIVGRGIAGKERFAGHAPAFQLVEHDHDVFLLRAPAAGDEQHGAEDHETDDEEHARLPADERSEREDEEETGDPTEHGGDERARIDLQMLA